MSPSASFWHSCLHWIVEKRPCCFCRRRHLRRRPEVLNGALN